MSTSARVRVALIGAGRWGMQHARVFTARKDVELCAIAGRTVERTRMRADEYGVRPYIDIDKMLECEKPDLVSICLPNQGHFEPTLEVLRAGYAVLAEKPLAFALREADRLVEEAAKQKLFFAINFNHRYARPVQLAKAAVENGRLGEPVFAFWRFGGEGSSDHPFGNLIETQCHGLDMLEFLCGPIESITAQMTDKTGKGWSTLVLALRFHNGAVGGLVGSYDSSYAYTGTHLMELNGTHGRVWIEDTVRQYSFQAAGNEIAEVWQAGYFNDRDRAFYHTFDLHLDALLRAFREGAEPPVPAEAGRRALVLAHAAIRSWETGQRIQVDRL